MTNEAPTPDEIDTMMSDIGSLIRVPFQVSRGLQTAKKLRDHIAALEAKIATLEAGWNSEKIPSGWTFAAYDMSKYKLLEKTKIAALEAENKRLRDLLGGANYTYLGAEYVACLEPDAITAALAQTGEK